MPAVSRHPLPFNSQAVAKARCHLGARTEYRIAGVRGLMLRVDQKNSGIYWFRYQIGRGVERKRVKIRIGNRDAVPLHEARSRADELRRRVEAGGDPAREAQDHLKSPSFARVAEAWIAWKRQQGRAESYIKRSEERLAKDILPAIGNFKATDVTKADVTGILDRVAKRHAPYETNRVRALLRAMLKWAAGTGRIDVQPDLRPTSMFEERARERTLQDNEVRLIWRGISNAPASEAVRIAMKLCPCSWATPPGNCSPSQGEAFVGRSATDHHYHY